MLRNGEDSAFTVAAQAADLVGVEFDSGSVGCGVHVPNLSLVRFEKASCFSNDCKVLSATMISEYTSDVPSGGKRKGSGRKKIEDSVQVTTRLKRETLRKLKVEAERRLEPGQKRAEIGKVIDELAERLPESG